MEKPDSDTSTSARPAKRIKPEPFPLGSTRLRFVRETAWNDTGAVKRQGQGSTNKVPSRKRKGEQMQRGGQEERNARAQLQKDKRRGKRGRDEEQAEESEGAEDDPVNKHPWLWYADGHVLIVASDEMAFKLHPGILSLHSEVLDGLMRAAKGHSKDSQDVVIELPESGDALEWFFEVIYQSGKSIYFNNDDNLEFPYLRTVLLMAIKYEVQHVIDSGIRRLRNLFPSQLQNWTNWPVNGAHHPIEITKADAIAVAQIARESGCLDILPAALYVCSILPPLMIVNGTKYGTERVKLTAADQATCFGAQSQLAKMRNQIIRPLLEGSAGSLVECSRRCTAAFSELALQASDNVIGAANRCISPLDRWVDRANQEIQDPLCRNCVHVLKKELNLRMNEQWAILGQVYGVVDWPAA